jgi:hypothetical protein
LLAHDARVMIAVFSETWRKPRAISSLSHAFIGVANHGTQSSISLDRMS